MKARCKILPEADQPCSRPMPELKKGEAVKFSWSQTWVTGKILDPCVPIKDNEIYCYIEITEPSMFKGLTVLICSGELYPPKGVENRIVNKSANIPE